MTKQDIPLAFPSDTELLNALQANTATGHLWVCVVSPPCGKAWIQQTSPESDEVETFEWDAYPTVRKAIAVGLGLIEQPSSVGR